MVNAPSIPAHHSLSAIRPTMGHVVRNSRPSPPRSLCTKLVIANNAAKLNEIIEASGWIASCRRSRPWTWPLLVRSRKLPFPDTVLCCQAAATGKSVLDGGTPLCK